MRGQAARAETQTTAPRFLPATKPRLELTTAKNPGWTMKISESRPRAATTRTLSTQLTTADALPSWLAKVKRTALAQQTGGFRRPTRSTSATERGSRRVIDARRGGDRREKRLEGAGRAVFRHHGIRFVVDSALKLCAVHFSCGDQHD